MEAGREGKEYFSVASEREGLFKVMEHKGDHESPFETASSGTHVQCPFQHMMPPLADENWFWLSGWHEN